MDTQQRTYRKICQHCGKEFIALTSVTNYCSQRCASLGNKHRKRDEYLITTSIEVRERRRLSLLDKNFLTISDAARLMQMSRNTLYKIIKLHGIELKRFTDRTVRISREDLDRAATGITPATTAEKEDILSNWMTKEQIMEEYSITLSWFTSTIKRHRIQPRIIGNRNFYDKDQMEAIFTKNDFSDSQEWYTFDQVREQSGMRTESICDYCKAHKIQRERKNGITYVNKPQWDKARGNTIDPEIYITMKEITDTYGLSRNHLYTIFKDKGLKRIKIGNFTYFNREDVADILTKRR